MGSLPGSGLPPAAQHGRLFPSFRRTEAKSSNKGAWLGAVAFASALASLAGCSSGRVPRLEVLAVASDEREGELPYRVFLPPGYPAAAPYPALYFLHDYYGGSATLWRRGVADELATRMRDGRLAPLVIVAPEGEHAWWSDTWDGARSSESWVTGALRDEIERRYAVRRDRAGRAVTGISMGGFGAIKVALRRPELYGAASSLSGALLALDRESVAGYPLWTRRQLARIFGPVNDPRATYDANDLRPLLAAADPAKLPRILLRCGREDEYGLAGLQQELAAFAQERGVAVDAGVEPGAHDWSYWRKSLVEAIEWHGARFAEAAAAEGGRR